jgi:hypothetical protein
MVPPHLAKPTPCRDWTRARTAPTLLAKLLVLLLLLLAGVLLEVLVEEQEPQWPM